MKVSESAIKIVIDDKRKWLARLNQTVLEVGRVIASGLSWPIRLPVDSRHLTQCTPEVERGNPVCLPFRLRDSLPRGEPMGMPAWEVGRSECWAVMAWIRV